MSKEALIEKALSSLGRGFDITSGFRLKYCKGEERLILLNEVETKELEVPGFGSIENVSIDIKCDKGDRTRYQSDVLEFNQMSELFNRKSHISGKVPSGQFNSKFGFSSSSWSEDASNTKCLALDGYYIVLFNLHIERSPLFLIDEVHNAVPSTWNPVAIARFIEKYGTHIIVGLSIGGEDVVLVRQDKSSNLQSSQIKEHLDTLGDQLFTGSCTLNKDNRQKVPAAFNVFDPEPVISNSFSSVTGKDGITVVCCKRGGDASTATNHCEWLPTVAAMPDAIHFSFMPITSLLKPSLPGKGLLSHAINLYLRYKPPIADLKYFLDFQSHTLWAPIHNDLPLGSTTNMAVPTPTTLYFNFMGPKMYVNTAQVTVGRRPVTGMRLYLEGMKCNRLAVHLQHLSNMPKVLENIIDDMSVWRGSDEVADERYLEAIQSKRYSHVSTVLIEYEPDWMNGKHFSFIVTGVQLYVKKHESKSVLHLRLLFSKVANSTIRKSVITQGPSDFHSRSSTISMPLFSGNLDKEKQPMVVIDSAVFPTGPPMSAYTHKLLRYVDTSEIYKGPQDSPGYWIVTGAKLDVEKGKICLHVKFSLLNFSSLSMNNNGENATM